MYKVISLLKRRKGMSLEDFMDYYEKHHARIGETYFPGIAVHYVRRYFKPLPHPLTGEVTDEPDFDVMNEVWYENEADFERLNQIVSDPKISEYVVEDEKKLFDRDKMRLFIAYDERVTDLDACARGERIPLFS